MIELTGVVYRMKRIGPNTEPWEHQSQVVWVIIYSLSMIKVNFNVTGH